MRSSLSTIKSLVYATIVRPQGLLNDESSRNDVKLSNLIFILWAVLGSIEASIEDFVEYYFITFPIYILLFFGILKYILPVIYQSVGRIWKGNSSIVEMRMAVALSLVPQIIFSPILLTTLVFWDEFSTSNRGLSYLVNLWSFILLILYIKKVQGFSNQLAILNVVLPALVGVVLVYLLVSLT